MHGQRNEEASLRVPMAPRDVSDVKERRPFWRAMVEDVEHRVQISIEIDGGPDNPLENERSVCVIPPSMGSACLEDRGFPHPGPYLAPLGCGR